MSNYSEKLKNPKWQKKRLEIFNRDNWTCQNCNAKDQSLQVHHRYYDSDKEPWEYDEQVFITLCEFCHKYETENRKKYESLLIKNIRRNYLTNEIEDLAYIFNGLKIHSINKIWCQFLHKVLTNDFILQKYCEIDYETILEKLKEQAHGSDICPDKSVSNNL